MTPMTASHAMYRMNTIYDSLRALYKLTPEHVDEFISAYAMFERDQPGEDDEQQLVHYYRVINHLCAIGEVEKMYIPPIIDPSVGIIENQDLFEEKMCWDLALAAGQHVLDVGCGRGRVAAHLAALCDAHVTGINIDPSQLDSAVRYASDSGLSDKCDFIKANFNNPLPFEDESFDALYHIQVISYAKDKEKLFEEMFRVLKPGGRISFLDWVLLDAFDEENPLHRGLLSRVKPLVGAVDSPRAHEIRNLLEKVGFHVRFCFRLPQTATIR